MASGIKVVHIDDVDIEKMQERDGWAISEFRLPISGADGSATTMFHSRFRAGSAHAKHVHHRCDEFVSYLAGRGIVATGNERAEVLPGHRRRIPQGAPHFYANRDDNQLSVAVGFYIGAGSVADSGYEYLGDVGEADTRPPFEGITQGVLVHVDDVAPADVTGFDAWTKADVRFSVGTATGHANALLDIRVPAGAQIADHRLTGCEQVYFVIAGSGTVGGDADEQEVRADSALFVPQGGTFALRNTGDDPLWLVGVWTGAGGFEEAGYRAG